MVSKSTVFKTSIPRAAVTQFLEAIDLSLENPELFPVEQIQQAAKKARKAFLVFEPFYYTHSFRERLTAIENKTKLINIIRELAKSQGYLLCGRPSFEKSQVKFYCFLKHEVEVSPISLLPDVLESEFKVLFS